MTKLMRRFMAKQYYVYIMTNRHNTVLYTGVTNNLRRRAWEHREGRGGQFTRKYNVEKLVFCEATSDVKSALSREKQIKAGSRRKKIDLVNGMNPTWKDLCDEL
jgi:putative endonuclease